MQEYVATFIKYQMVQQKKSGQDEFLSQWGSFCLHQAVHKGTQGST